MRKKDVSRWVLCRSGSKGVELASTVAFVLQANFKRKKNTGKENIENNTMAFITMKPESPSFV